MKNKCLLFIFFACLNNPLYAQKINPTRLQNLAGKEIVSTVSITSDTRSSTIGINNKNIETIPTGRKQTTQKSINLGKNGLNIKINFVIQHIKAAIYGSSGESIYDSDNVFERSGAASAFGSRFDPIIGKKITAIYDYEGKPISAIDDALFEQTWNTGTPKISLVAEWNGIFQMSALASGWEKGKTWTDTLRSPKEEFINTYAIKEINNELVKITLKGRSKPVLTASKAGINTEQQGSAYDGILEVVKSTGFIQQFELSRESETLSEVEGIKISSRTITKTIVKNKVN